MSDWEVVQNEQKGTKYLKPSSNSEWEAVGSPSYDDSLNSSQSFEPEESKGLSGVATDALGKSFQTIMGIPSGLMALPGEAYGAGKQAISDKKRFAQNVGAGFANLGHGVLSAPGNIRDYLAKKDLVSNDSPSFRLPESVLPKDYNYAEALGAKGHQAGDELIRGIPAGIASIQFANRLFAALSDIHVTGGAGARALNTVQHGLEERGMGRFEIPREVLRDLNPEAARPSGMLRNTAANRRMLARARQGDYRDLFALQSDLGRRQRNLTRFPFFADMELGHDIGHTRQTLLDSMREQMGAAGHEDLAQLMQHGQNRYRQYMAFRPYRNALAAAIAAYNLPYYKDIKKLLP